MATKAPTSDGEERPNTRAVVLPTIPTKIDENARQGVLVDLQTALLNAGGTITPLSRSAAYQHSSLTRHVNALITAANAKGATPAMATYGSIDYNAFASVMAKIAAGLATIP